MVSEVVESDVAKDDVFTTVVCIVFLVLVGVVTTFVWSFASSVYWFPSSIENLAPLPRLASGTIFGRTLAGNPKYQARHDAWKGAIFYINVAVVFVVACLSLDFRRIYSEQKFLLLISEPIAEFAPNYQFHTSSWFLSVTFIVVVGLCLGVLYWSSLSTSAAFDVNGNLNQVNRRFGGHMLLELIYCGSSLLLGFCSLCVFWTYSSWLGAVMALISLFLLHYYYTLGQGHFDTSGSMLTVALVVLQRNGFALCLYVLMGLLLQAGWVLLCSLAALGVTLRLGFLDHLHSTASDVASVVSNLAEGSSNDGGDVVRYEVGNDRSDRVSNELIGCVLYLWVAVSLFWGLETIKDVLAVTVGGTVITWWFPDTTSIDQRSRLASSDRPTVRSSFAYATTGIFGSICRGSLLLSWIQSLRYMFHHVIPATSLDNDNRAPTSWNCNSLPRMLLTQLERHHGYLHRYTYACLAAYGLDLRTSGHVALELFASRGMREMVGSDVIPNALWLFTCCLGLTGALTGLMITSMIFTGQNLLAGAVYGLVVGIVVGALVTSVLDSAVAMVYFCFAEDVVTLEATRSSMFQVLQPLWRELEMTLEAQKRDQDSENQEDLIQIEFA